MSKGVKLRVWGDYACFTRPEMKVERVSYDVMTPSAARGILEAIYWKPSIRWVIKAIHVIRPIAFTNIRRNEVASKISFRNAKSAMKGNTELPNFFIEEDRQQRAAMVLRRVEYVIEAEFEVLTDEKLRAKGIDVENRGDDDRTDGKHIDQFRRRARDGRCFKQPVFGCREFPARFELIENEETLPVSCYAEQGEKDLGWMLYDMDFSNKKNIKPMFFQAKMRDGIVEVPHPDSEEVKR